MPFVPTSMDPAAQPPGAQPQQPGGPQGPRQVSEQDRALSRELQKAIESAERDQEEARRQWAQNRKRLRGINPDDGKRWRTNLHFASLASMRPQVYAKDPEFSVQASPGVPPEMLPAVREFGSTCVAVLDAQLVQGAALKRRARRLVTSAYTNALGWWKLCWQDGRPADPLIDNRLKDTRDNIAALEHQRQALADQAQAGDHDRKLAELRETLAGLQVQAEVRVGRGLVLDFVLPEDLLILDESIREVQDYARAARLAHGVWMSRERFREEFGYNPEKARVYRSRDGSAEHSGQAVQSAAANKDGDLLRVWEVWDQRQNRVHTVCFGDEGLVRASYSPDWTGRRWYPFFALVWNEVDAAMYPPSDVELTAELNREYNEARADLVQDRRDSRPFTLFRKGGQLTPADVENIRNRRGNDLIGVEGIGNQPLANDIQSVVLGQINPALYDTTPARVDIEQLLGGGDAARGSVLTAKTATEAEILSQGLRSRSAERVDEIEDLLSDVGGYALEVCLRKLSRDEVMRIAGPSAQWPEMSVEDVLRQVTVRVRGGSTGKPDRLQEQDRWTQLLPVIKDTVREIVEVRGKPGGEQLGRLAMALLKETLRRFDERFEVDQYLPEDDGEQVGEGITVTPEMLQQAQEMVQQLQDQLAELQRKLEDKAADREADVRKAQINAAASVESAVQVAQINAAASVQVARINRQAGADEDAGEAGEGGEGQEMEPDDRDDMQASPLAAALPAIDPSGLPPA